MLDKDYINLIISLIHTFQCNKWDAFQTFFHTLSSKSGAYPILPVLGTFQVLPSHIWRWWLPDWTVQCRLWILYFYLDLCLCATGACEHMRDLKSFENWFSPQSLISVIVGILSIWEYILFRQAFEPVHKIMSHRRSPVLTSSSVKVRHTHACTHSLVADQYITQIYR